MLNILTLILSIIGVVLSFHAQTGEACQRAIHKPVLIVSVFVLVISILGLIGACCRSNIVMVLYLVLLFVLIIGTICAAVFVFVVTNKGAGKAISGKGYKEYRLGDYSHWLQKYLVDGNKWQVTKSCLSATQICTNLRSLNDYTPIQLGCCMPPSICDFVHKNTTFWEVPKSGPAVQDSDCTTWSNNHTKLCYDCTTCKGGFLANIKSQWRTWAIVLVCLCIFLILVYSTGCCAFRNNRSYYRNSIYKYNA